MLKYHVTGRWKRGEVELRWAPSTYRSTPESDAQIDAAWAAAKARLGEKLFDGPMCRLEKFAVEGEPPGEPFFDQRALCQGSAGASPSTLVLSLSLTSYRIFLGTNMSQPQLPEEHRANPVGVSTLLVTADNFLMLGRRSDNVAYYPRMIHPFAGSLEPLDTKTARVEGDARAESLVELQNSRDGSAGASPSTSSRAPDLFDNALRELHEELGLTHDQIVELACLGIVEDRKLRHPEAILYARTIKTKREIEASLLGDEHDATWSCPATAEAIGVAIADSSLFTPVAMASNVLFSRLMRGGQ